MRKLLISLLIMVAGSCTGTAFGFRQIDLEAVIQAGQPTAVAVDEAGRIYIGQEDGTVRVVTADGAPVTTLGGRGVLSRPGGIAVTGESILVTDQKQGRVAVFSRDGAPTGSFGKEGDDPKEFDRPTGILAAGGVVYVADTENDRVQIFGPNGVFLGIIGRTGSGEELLDEPTSLAVDAEGRLLVLEGSGQVKIYGPMGGYQGRIVPPGKTAALAVDPEGIFVADQKGFRVCKIDFKGKELFCFGSRGKDRSQFESLDTLALDAAGRILVGDHRKKVVQVLAPAEKVTVPAERVAPQTTVRWMDEIAGLRLRQLARAPDGGLFGIPEKEKVVVVFGGSAAEKTVRVPGWDPVALTIDAEGGLWVIDDAKSRVVKVDETGRVVLSFGSSGSRDGQFDEPADLAVSKKGLVYVADRDNARIQVFNTQGTFLKVLGGQNRLLDRPAAIEVDEADQVFVLDAKKTSVFVFSPEGRPLLSFGGKGSGPADFDTPVDLAVTPDEIFVLDAAGSVKVFGRDGRFQRLFGARGTGLGDFKQPSALVALAGTELLVADAGQGRLQRFQLIYTPAAPRDLQGEAGMRTVSLAWTPNGENYLKNYRIYRSPGCTGEYLPLADLTEAAYRDGTVLPDVPYCYRLAALARDGNESAWSAAARIVPTPIVPPPPREISATAQEWSVDLSWATTEADRTISAYRIYREVDGRAVMVGEVPQAGFYEGNLEPDTEYRYAVCAVSIDAVESERVPVKVTTQVATRPPLEIEVLALEDIFSNTYKIYQTDGIGRLRITNNTRDPLSKIKVTFTLKEFMDFPWEHEISNLGPRESQEITLRAVFNNRVLEVTEDTPVQAEIIASHYKNQDLRSYSRIETVRLFEKHRMMWDERDRFSAFVTPKDPVILEFARGIVTQFGEYADPLVQAGVLFDALGVVGIGYLQDPSNPYQITSEKTDFVDYLQYPRETISRRSGDCDDLVGLFASLLESFGIRTLAVEVPGHMFLMFATGQEKVAADDPLREMQIEHDGMLWAPVEVTMIGQPFMKAWEAGSRSYREWQGRGLDHLDVRKAWEQFKPATLPNVDWRAPVVTREAIESRFREDVHTLRRIRLQNRGQIFLARLKENPQDASALVQLAIVYARAGEAAEAAAVLEKARTLRPDDAAVVNNLGNIYFLSGQLEQAAKAYADAVRTDPGDPNILVNLARVLLRLERKEEATQAFRQATEISPGIAAEYKTLAIALGTPY